MTLVTREFTQTRQVTLNQLLDMQYAQLQTRNNSQVVSQITHFHRVYRQLQASYHWFLR